MAWLHVSVISLERFCSPLITWERIMFTGSIKPRRLALFLQWLSDLMKCYTSWNTGCSCAIQSGWFDMKAEYSWWKTPDLNSSQSSRLIERFISADLLLFLPRHIKEHACWECVWVSFSLSVFFVFACARPQAIKFTPLQTSWTRTCRTLLCFLSLIVWYHSSPASNVPGPHGV